MFGHQTGIRHEGGGGGGKGQRTTKNKKRAETQRRGKAKATMDAQTATAPTALLCWWKVAKKKCDKEGGSVAIVTLGIGLTHQLKHPRVAATQVRKVEKKKGVVWLETEEERHMCAKRLQ